MISKFQNFIALSGTCQSYQYIHKELKLREYGFDQQRLIWLCLSPVGYGV